MSSLKTTYFSLFRSIISSLFLLFGIIIFIYLWYLQIPIFRQNEEQVLVILDRSLSMAIEDVGGGESRLGYAKKNIEKKLSGSKSIGIITFAKNPHLLIPISKNSQNIFAIINNISPERDIGGSDLSLALQFAINLYSEKNITLLIYSDGGNISSLKTPKIPQNWRVSLYGIGSEPGGKIPLGYNANGERRYKYYSGSEIVIPYEKKWLQEFSKEIGGTFIDNIPLSGTAESYISFFIRNNFLYFFATLLILFGIGIHPYGRKKINIR